ncbi:MAG TPA: hypothetical protein VET27_14745 [Mycobacterium sp.]|nr:hypothetical protein [Mycobacterium sp.]
MISNQFSGVAVAGGAAVTSWTLHVAGPVASAAHPTAATRDAIPATKRRTAAATVASVNRGFI